MSIDREFASQVVIVLAVCAGAWMLLVQPKAREVARVERQLAEAAQTSGLASQEGIEALADAFGEQKQRLQEIHRRNSQAEDTSSLYAAIMRLASETQVRVQALQPTPARDPGGRPEAMRVSRLEMTLSGPYQNVARFLDRVPEIDAFIRPASLQLIPVDGAQEQTVSARFSCDVLAFTVDSVLTAAGGSSHAQP